jgi:hypothetical protein
MKYTVLVNDNFHSMDETELLTDGEFDTEEAAIARAKEIVDKCLADLYSQLSQQRQPGIEMSSEELYRQYTAFGDNPLVVAEDRTVAFSGWSYAREKCFEIVSGKLSPSV